MDDSNLFHWDFLDDFAPEEASWLILGLDPTAVVGLHEERLKVSLILNRMHSDFERAKNECKFAGGKRKLDLTGKLASRVMSGMIDDAPTWFTWEEIHEWLETPKSSFAEQRFGREELAKWLDQNALKSIYPFARPLLTTQAPPGTQVVPSNDKKPRDLVGKSERSYPKIIAALLYIMLEDRPDGSKRAGFNNETKILEGILSRWEGERGLGKRNVEEAFAEAKRQLPPKRP